MVRRVIQKFAIPTGPVTMSSRVNREHKMTKEQFRVELVGRAHKDAQELLLKSSAGVAEYIAMSDGTVCTINRELIGHLPKKLAPLKKHIKSARFDPHGYRGDKSLREK